MYNTHSINYNIHVYIYSTLFIIIDISTFVMINISLTHCDSRTLYDPSWNPCV